MKSDPLYRGLAELGADLAGVRGRFVVEDTLEALEAGRSMRVAPWFLAWILLSITGVAACAGEVRVEVVNVGSAEGSVRAELCREPEWLRDGCARKERVPARKGLTTLVFRDVAPGRWAVVAFHDKNDNGEVDRSLLGVPEEGVGFSRDPRLGLSGPRFEASAIAVGPEGAVAPVRLHFE